MDKKRLLFIIPSLSAGGGEKSLVNLLSLLDFTYYEVDLLLLNIEGVFTDLIPREVNIIPLSKNYKLFCLPLLKSMLQLFFKGHFFLMYNRLFFSFINRFNKTKFNREQKAWKYYRNAIDKIDKQYDVAIGFLEKTSIYLCVEKVEAKHKIGWIHNDYDKLGMNPKFDFKYFKNLNKIVTVSEKCATVLKRRFPSLNDNIEIMYNIVSPKVIIKMANQEINPYGNDGNEFIILSIGRLHYQKGFELAIETCEELVNKGYKIKWYIIGDGEEKENLKNMIKNKNLEDIFILLGLKSNPYPYILHADLYVQTSRFEGKSIAIDEAKILQKPILVTNFSTATDQINNNVNGIIVDMSTKEISNGVERLVNNRELRKMLIRNLSNENLGTENEIKKFYNIIGDKSEKKTVVCN